MTSLRRLVTSWLVAGAVGAGFAFPAAAAVTFQSGTGDVSWSYLTLGFANNPDYTPAIGPNGDSVYSYGLTCYVEGCIGLPWGGSLLSASWSADVGNNSLNYSFNVLEGTDSGSEDTNISVFLVYHTDRSPLIFVSDSASATPPGPGCVGCQDTFSWSSSSQVDPGGGYDLILQVTSDVPIQYGENIVSDQLTATIGEVPEPATWAMMFAGLAGVGAVLRARRGRSLAA